MADTKIDKDLATNIKKARKLPAERPFFFALIVKGPSAGKLLIGKKKIQPKAIADAKKEAAANLVVKGVCYGEGGALVFEVVKPPAPNWTTLARKLAKDDAGIAIKAEFRQGRDDEAMPDEFEHKEEEGAEDESEDAGDAEMETAVAADEAWKKRVDEVTAKVKAAAAAKNPAARDMVLGISEAQAFYRGKDAAKAGARMTQVEALLAGGTTVPTAPPMPEAKPKAEGKPTDAAAAWKARVDAVTARVKAAAAAKHPSARDMVLGVSEAGTFFRGGDAAKADARLKQVEAMLGGDSTTPPEAPPKPEAPKQEAPKPTGNGWAAAREGVVTKLKAIAKEVAAAKHAESSKALIELNAVIKNLSPEVSSKQQLAELERYLQQDDVVMDVCEMAEDIRTPLLKALADLKPQLSA